MCAAFSTDFITTASTHHLFPFSKENQSEKIREKKRERTNFCVSSVKARTKETVQTKKGWLHSKYRV